MLKDALLELGLTEEQADKVLGMNETEVSTLSTEKEKLTENVSKLMTSLDERDNQLKQLQESADNSDELKKQLEDAISKNEEDAKNAVEERKRTLLELSLVNEGAKNVKSVLPLLNLEKITVDGNNLIGFREQIEAIRNSDSFLFEEKLKGREPYAGSKGSVDEYKDNPFKRETLNLTRQSEIYKKDPELAKKMMEAAGYKLKRSGI